MAAGQHARGTGCLQVRGLARQQLLNNCTLNQQQPNHTLHTTPNTCPCAGVPAGWLRPVDGEGHRVRQRLQVQHLWRQQRVAPTAGSGQHGRAAAAVGRRSLQQNACVGHAGACSHCQQHRWLWGPGAWLWLCVSEAVAGTKHVSQAQQNSSCMLSRNSHNLTCLLCVLLFIYTQALGYGPPELVTCGGDGCVRVWDVRQEDAPVAAFEPADSNNIRCVVGGGGGSSWPEGCHVQRWC